MNKRIYNVLFHTHTVSGLLISIALFVIFFAGSISFFRDDIINWERNQPIKPDTQLDIDFDKLLDSINARHELYGRDIALRQIHQERRVMVSISSSKDTTAEEAAQRRAFFYQDPETQKSYSYFDDFTLGEFIYRLHFFAQLPQPYGYMLAGFVSFFFLFAIITGLIIHWDKIVSNFFVFRPWTKLKTVWTDAHTALGLIGLPFQLMYAVTGAAFIIGSSVMLAPVTSVFYDEDSSAMFEDISSNPDQYSFLNKPQKNEISLNELVSNNENQWADFYTSQVLIQNYGDENMHVIIDLKPFTDVKFSGFKQMIYHVGSDELIAKSDHKEEASFLAILKDVMLKLHYGSFGGYAVKILYFIFGILGCLVILSGVLIWEKARDKKINTAFKRKSNAWISAIFLAIALSMYPVTAFSFIAVKLFGGMFQPHHTFIYVVYFIPWLILSILFALKKDNYFTNKYCLLSGGILGMFVPLANGLVTGNWFWNTYHPEHFQIFAVDAFWLITSFVALFSFFQLKSKKLANS